MPALIRKAHEAKQAGTGIIVWGTGAPRREFLYVEDCADACVFLMKRYSEAGHINVGSGEDVSILEVTRCEVVGLDAEISHDLAKPDGTPRKLMDVSRLAAAGWTATTTLRDGVARSYDWFLAHAR